MRLRVQGCGPKRPKRKGVQHERHPADAAAPGVGVMTRPLYVRHTVSCFDAPLLCFVNLPGPDAEMFPAAARALAAALLAAASDCEALVRDARRYGPQRREYDISAPPLAAPVRAAR